MSETETGEAYKEDTENFYYILIYTNKKLIHIYVINNQEQIEDPSRQRTIIEEEYYEEAPSSSPPFPFLISPSPSNFFSPLFFVFSRCFSAMYSNSGHFRPPFKVLCHPSPPYATPRANTSQCLSSHPFWLLFYNGCISCFTCFE
jgi:hypothetical protein